MPFTFQPGDKVTFDLDPDDEILIVVKSGFYRTEVKTFDGIELSHSTELLSYAQVPTAV